MEVIEACYRDPAPTPRWRSDSHACRAEESRSLSRRSPGPARKRRDDIPQTTPCSELPPEVPDESEAPPAAEAVPDEAPREPPGGDGSALAGGLGGEADAPASEEAAPADASSAGDAAAGPAPAEADEGAAAGQAANDRASAGIALAAPACSRENVATLEPELADARAQAARAPTVPAAVWRDPARQRCQQRPGLRGRRLRRVSHGALLHAQHVRQGLVPKAPAPTVAWVLVPTSALLPVEPPGGQPLVPPAAPQGKPSAQPRGRPTRVRPRAAGPPRDGPTGPRSPWRAPAESPRRLPGAAAALAAAPSPRPRPLPVTGAAASPSVPPEVELQESAAPATAGADASPVTTVVAGGAPSGAGPVAPTPAQPRPGSRAASPASSAAAGGLGGEAGQDAGPGVAEVESKTSAFGLARERVRDLQAKELAERADLWPQIFSSLHHDLQVHHGDLPQAVELSGMAVPDPKLIDEVCRCVTGDPALGQDEFNTFMHTYIMRQNEAFTDAFERRLDEDALDLEVDLSVLPQLVKDLGLLPMRHVLAEAIREVTQSREDRPRDRENAIGVHDFLKVARLLLLREGFTKQEHDALQRMHARFDRDGSGDMSTKELREVLLRLGYAIDQRRVDELLSSADMDFSGSLNKREFILCMRWVREREVKIIGDFIRMSNPGQSCLTNPVELEGVLKSLGYAPMPGAVGDAARDTGVAEGSELSMDDVLRILEVFRSRAGFGADEAEEIRSCFARRAGDLDGEVSGAQAVCAIRSLGYCVPFQEAQLAIRRVDLNGNSMLDFREFQMVLVSARGTVDVRGPSLPEPPCLGGPGSAVNTSRRRWGGSAGKTWTRQLASRW
ncbi:unnamed protein product [Prorocentrum cordatum]|uniref:EF-hand domain-containing protein n=1 Tax=Prorocentrum cordatum TaxID=2364126 RepID=A0ABN9UZX4_9DINO|nr:unnamed protein product [Polarella glacialis]